MHKNVHRGAHGRLRVMGLEREESRRVALSSGLAGILEVKDSLDRTGMKKQIKQQQFTHLNVAPDALPGSARLVHVLDHWLNDYEYYTCIALFLH